MSKKIKNLRKYTMKKVKPDPLYQSYWYSKFVNKFMRQGKKHVVEKIISRTLHKMKIKFNRAPVNLLFIALIKLKPLLGFITKRVGKNWKSIPVPLEPRRQLVLALKWFVVQVRMEPEKNLEAQIFHTFNTFFKQSKNWYKNPLIRRKNLHYYNAAKDRVNSRYRWI